MKHKAWFLYLIITLLAVNLSFYLFFRYGNVSQKIKSKISKVLGKTLDAKVTIGNISLNDKQLNISQFKMIANDKSFNVCSKQIYVEFSLYKLIKARFKNFRGINYIRIYDPKLYYNIKPSGKKNKKKKEFVIPDLRNFFKKLDLVNGQVEIVYNQHNVYFDQQLKNVEIEIDNKKLNRISVKAVGTNKDTISAKVTIKEGKIADIDANIKSYFPTKIKVPNLKISDVSVNLSITDEKISGYINNADVSYSKWHIIDKKVKISGSEKRLKFFFEDAIADGNLFSGDVTLIDLIRKNRKILANLKTANVDLHKYTKHVTGKADANIVVSGKLISPVVKINAFSKKIRSYGEIAKNASVKVLYEDGKFSFDIKKAYWENNLIAGKGGYSSRKGFTFHLYNPKIKFSRYGLDFDTDITFDIKAKENAVLKFSAQNVNVAQGDIKLENMTLNAGLKDYDWNIDLAKDKNIKLHAKGDFKDNNINANLKIRRLKLSEIFDNLVFPITSGSINFKYAKDKFISDADMVFYDQSFGKFDGHINYDFKIDYKKNKSNFKLITHNARYNFEPFSITLNAQGTADSLTSTNCNINDKIKIDAFVKMKPKLEGGIKIMAQELKSKEILKYFTDYETLKNFGGKLSFVLDYQGFKSKNLLGVVKAKKLRIGNIKNLNADVSFFGNKSFFTLDKFVVSQGDNNFFAAQGNMVNKPVFRAKFIGKLQNMDMDKFLPHNGLNGKLNGDFAYYIKDSIRTFDAEIRSEKSKIFGVKIDSLDVIVSQKNKLLKIIKLYAKSKKNINFTASGALGYNMFSQNFYPDSSSVKLNFSGDLLSILSGKIEAITKGKSRSKFNFDITTNENGLSITKGTFSLNNGLLKIKGQPAPTEKINIAFDINRNRFNIKKFRLKMGKGYVHILNKIKNNENDFKINNLNLGQFFFNTTSKGILLFIPGYVAEGSFLNVVVAGRSSDNMEILGPFDDIKIKGNVTASNGNIIYPPHTENLLNIIKTPIATKGQESETVYPFSLDLLLKVGENVHYTTYPINLLMKKGGYINLVYQNNIFSVPDAFFVSDQGDVDILGTHMKADYLSVKINKLVNGFKLDAEFYKNIPDGTVVTMVIYSETDEKMKNNIKFRFISDRAGDGTMDIISMLRYGKRLEDINSSQRKNILQDELVQIAGIGIENAFITPLFYPFENMVRHWLKLDYFNIKTGIVQNIFNRYYQNDNQIDVASDENGMTKYGMDVFLNNLSLEFTKHVYKKTFLDYTLTFQKPTDMAIASQIGVYHNLSFKIEIPYGFRLSLDYNIMPFNEKNSEQIGLEKSLKF